MTAYLFLLHVGGAVALLLWAVHMVHTGTERGWRPELHGLLRATDKPLRSALVGTGLGFALQSSTAAGMLAAAYAGKGLFTLATGLAIVLGANLGSALVVLILSLDLSFLPPVLLIGGALLFFKGKARRTRQSGRALVGLGLIFVSLQMLEQATAPLSDSDLLPAVVTYLAGDPLTALIAGAALALAVPFLRRHHPAAHRAGQPRRGAVRGRRAAAAGRQYRHGDRAVRAHPRAPASRPAG